MSDPTKAWTDAWAASQQAFFKGLIPAPAQAGDPEPARPRNPLEDHFAELSQTWQSSIAKWTEFAKSLGSDGMPSAQALRAMFEPARWSGPGAGVFDAALQSVLEGPKYATLWDLDRKLLELQRLRQERDTAIAAYQAVVQKGWNKAFERFSAGFVAGGANKAPATWRAFADRWLGAANDALIELHRSDEFVQAQRRMLRSASDMRLKERELVEAWCEANQMPTRTEVDELQRTVVELRRQLRALQREKRTAAPVPAQAADGANE